MSEHAQMLAIIKQAAVEAVGAEKPFALTFGVVKSASPLTITVDQKLQLGPAQLLLTNSVRDYSVDITVDHQTEEAEAHRHAYTGRKKFAVHSGLQAGEKVLLLRMQGGQQYVVLDRVEAPS